MFKRKKIGRNSQCPCLSGKKYKHCCKNSVDWNRIIQEKGDPIQHLSIRGRNQLFMESLIDVLQLDSKDVRDIGSYKKAFTPDAVRKIHEAIDELWPLGTDISKVLAHKPEDVSGLYVGDYNIDYLHRGVIRHSIYANKILIVDPFIYPRSVREEFNPIANPDQHRSQTLKNVNIWLSLYPWIDAGIVEIIRTPADFDPRLNWDSMKRQEKKFKLNEKLQKAAEITVDDITQRHSENMAYEMLLLGAPDSQLESIFSELDLEKKEITFDFFIKYVQQLRDDNPNFLGPVGQDGMDGQLHMMSSGANYEIAQITAGLTNSYLVTDLHSRWAEIEIAREEANVESRVWSPFAKAIQNAPFKYLNNVGLQEAKQLREEGRLDSMRSFLKRVWKGARDGDDFDEQNARLMSEELLVEIEQAEREWKQIDRDLIKLSGAEMATGLLASGPLIASGHALFLGAAAVIAGVSNLAHSTAKRRSFSDRFPAAFFMNIKVDD